MPYINEDIIPQGPLDRLKPMRDNSSRRRKTFETFPKSAAVSIDSLMQDGFYYVGKSDKVQCAYCGGILSDFSPNDNVRTEHRRHFPYCSHVKELDRMKYGSNTSPDVCASDFGYTHSYRPSSPDLEIDGMTGSLEKTKLDIDIGIVGKFPQYKAKDARLKSFRTWPKEYINLLPKPEELADAGLFYTEKDDCTQCYGCGNLLMEWESGDKPKAEHDRFFPDCPLAGK